MTDRLSKTQQTIGINRKARDTFTSTAELISKRLSITINKFRGRDRISTKRRTLGPIQHQKITTPVRHSLTGNH